MYPSDEYMVYGNGVDNTCYTDPFGCSGQYASKGWVYKSNALEGQSSTDCTWFLSSRAGESKFVLNVRGSYNSNGSFAYGNLSDYTAYTDYGVRPVVYLKASVEIDSGTGTALDPYKLK